MPPSVIVTGLARVLAEPDAVLPEDRVGSLRPALASDLPSIAVALSFRGAPRPPTTRFVREGHQRTEHVARVTAAASAGGFNADRTQYTLEPLPLVRPPLGRADVTVMNVTDPNTPRPLRRVAAPTEADEYRIDHQVGRVIFGAALQAGDVFEVSHWTVSWREPLAAECFEGVLDLEVWAGSADELASIRERLESRLALNQYARRAGFLRLTTSWVDAADCVRQGTGAGSDFPAWRQRLAYEFAFESMTGGTESAGDRIHRIAVDLDNATPDQFTIGS